MLHAKSTLVRLNVSQWTARRFDKAASLEVERAHNATNAGRFNKMLIDKAHLDPIESVASAMRAKHYKMTLPWQDDGTRLLPNALFMEYSNAMAQLRRSFEAEVQTFCQRYPELVQAARQRLGSMYRPEDYPVDVQGRFSVQIQFTPVPRMDDFRVDGEAELENKIRTEVTASVTEALQTRQREIMDDCWRRIYEAVERVRDRCSSAKPVIHDTLMGNISELVELLPALNISGDPKLTEATDHLRSLVVPTTRLRTSAVMRRTTAEAADDILNRFSWAKS